MTKKAKPGALIPCTFDQAAETTRTALHGMMLEVGKTLDGCDLPQADAVQAIAEGSIAYAIDAYLRLSALFGIPLDQIKASLAAGLEHYWAQAVTSHALELDKRADQKARDEAGEGFPFIPLG